MKRFHTLLIFVGFVIGCGDWIYPESYQENHSSTRLMEPTHVFKPSARIQVEELEASGNWFSFARMSDGTVYGWGNNFGQLGDATNIQRDVPVKVQACRDPFGGFISAGSAGTFFSEPSVLMVLGTGVTTVKLMPEVALVIGTDSMVQETIKGDLTNLAVIGSGGEVGDTIKDIGSVMLDGIEIQLSDVVRVENVRVTEGQSATIVGDLEFKVGLILEGGSTLTVAGDLECEPDSGVTLAPSATLEVQGEIDCPAITGD